jgi:hypothetical protein
MGTFQTFQSLETTFFISLIITASYIYFKQWESKFPA